MPALKLTKDLFYKDVFKSLDFKGENTDGVDKEILDLVLTARNAKEQINALKKATDLYETLFNSHKSELKISGYLSQYILPKILTNEPSAMKYIIPELSKQDSNCDSLHNEDGQRAALIMCLRRSRVLGQLKNNKHVDHGIKDMWCGIVDVKLLQQALNCKDEQIRLDALALLCENQKTTEVIEETEFQLSRNFIPSNLTNQNPAFRQHFLSLLKKITQDTEVDQQKKDWDNNEVPTLRTMFLDTHNYQEYVLMILKHSIAHKYKHMMLNLGYNIEDKCFKLLKDGQDWKSAESHYILPSVLVQQMKKT